jgi:hypothetical protein
MRYLIFGIAFLIIQAFIIDKVFKNNDFEHSFKVSVVLTFLGLFISSFIYITVVYW